MFTTRLLSTIVSFVVVLLGCWGAAAQPPVGPSDGGLTLSTERVVVFKDGYALMVKAATGTLAPDGTVFTDDVPDAAVLGCFWATADGAAIRTMKAEWVEEKSERTSETACMNVLELLRANQGRAVKLGLAVREDAFITGTIAEVLERPALKSAPEGAVEAEQPGHWGWNNGMPMPPSIPPRGETAREIVPVGGEFVSIDLEDKTRLVYPVAQIRSVSGAGLVTRMTRTEEVTARAKRLSFQLGEALGKQGGARSIAPGQPVALRVFYFTPGIRWIPTYRVETGDAAAKEAELSLQTEILNELEDIGGAKVDLVVGVPNFRFKGVISPMSLERELRSALATAAPQLMGQGGQFSNSMFSQRSSEYTAGHSPSAAPADAALALAPELAQGGSGEADLFVYTLDKFDLKKGARATVPLWSSKAPMEHVYTLDLRMVRDRELGEKPVHYAAAFNRNSNAPPPGPDSPLRLADGRVWHQVELRNQSSAPWTTGAALLLRGMLPLGQDMLTYTPVKACTLLPVTVAVDVQSSYEEQELERVPNALRWGDYSFAKVRKRATIKVSSFRSEASAMRVRLTTGGKASDASDDGKIVVNDFDPDDWGQNRWDYRPNNHSDVSWDFSLEAGKSKTLTVEFVVFVR
jgi:hypothetical protein